MAQDIEAAGSGIVIFPGWYGAYGNAVIIDHGNGISSLYGHMSSRSVAVNATVAPAKALVKLVLPLEHWSPLAF